MQLIPKTFKGERQFLSLLIIQRDKAGRRDLRPSSGQEHVHEVTHYPRLAKIQAPSRGRDPWEGHLIVYFGPQLGKKYPLGKKIQQIWPGILDGWDRAGSLPSPCELCLTGLQSQYWLCRRREIDAVPGHSVKPPIPLHLLEGWGNSIDLAIQIGAVTCLVSSN